MPDPHRMEVGCRHVPPPSLSCAADRARGCPQPPCCRAAYDAPAPSGAAPLRYRDIVFPTVTKTTVPYATVTGSDGQPQRLLMDVYRPNGDTATRRPVMIWVHGGYFAYGSRSEGAVTTLAQRFAQRGYVTASIDYRLLGGTGAALCTGGSTPPSCFSAALAAASDAKQAVQWFRRYPAALRIDPNRISMGGTSAGRSPRHSSLPHRPRRARPHRPRRSPPHSRSPAAPDEHHLQRGRFVDLLLARHRRHHRSDRVGPREPRDHAGEGCRRSHPRDPRRWPRTVRRVRRRHGHPARNWVYDQMDLELAEQRGLPAAQ